MNKFDKKRCCECNFFNHLNASPSDIMNRLVHVIEKFDKENIGKETV